MAARREYDESDARVRPSRRGSRPRSKDRPAHLDAISGTVVAVDRGRYTLLVQDRRVMAMKARELGRGAVVVGDHVGVVGDVSGADGSLARIVRIHPRESVLRRTADDTDPVERIIVANARQLAIVCAVADPTPRPRMIDRAMVAAYDAGLTPLLVITKADLGDAAQLGAPYAALEVPQVVTARDPATGEIRGLSTLRTMLRDQVSVFVGHSGVGKSTLVNALVPAADRAIGRVNAVTGRGRHTSTSVVALPLADDAGWIIDTPGIRSFGLAHVDPDRFIAHFPDLRPGTDQCPRGCHHDEPECGLDAWVEGGHAGPAGPARLDSLRRLLRSRAGCAQE